MEGGDTDDNSAAGFLFRKLPEDRLWRPTQRNLVTDKGKCEQTLWHSKCLNSQMGRAARVAGMRRWAEGVAQL